MSSSGLDRAAGQDPRGSSQPTVEEMQDEICREILAIHLESYSRGAATVKAHVLDEVVVVILEGVALLPSEEFLVQQGHSDAVAAVRDQFEQAIGASFRAVVERAIGRRVIAFTSHLQIGEPTFAVEVFRLEPRRG